MKLFGPSPIFKYDMLWVSATSCLFFDQTSAKWSVVVTPQELQQFYDQRTPYTTAVKIFLDGVPHRLIEGVRAKGFQRCQDVWRRTFTRHRPQLTELTFWHPVSAFKKIGFAVSLNAVQPWIDAINQLACTVAGIYSLPFEICKHAQTPQLFVLPTPFGQTRFIFGSPHGHFFHRLVDTQSIALPDQEIENTLVYLCRKFDLEYNHITVITDQTCVHIAPFVQNWHVLHNHQITPEAFLWDLVQSFKKPVQASDTYDHKWSWLKFVGRRFLPLITVLGLGLPVALSYQKYCDKKALQTAHQELQSAVLSLQKHTQNMDVQDLEHQINLLQPLSVCYHKIVKSYPQILQIIRDLCFDHSILIAQISCTLVQQDAQPCVRLLIECQLNDQDQSNALNNKKFEEYMDHLKKRMTPVSLIHSYEQPIVLDEAFQDSVQHSQKTRCFIQMDLAL